MRLDGLRQENVDGARMLEVELVGTKGDDEIALFELNIDGVSQ